MILHKTSFSLAKRRSLPLMLGAMLVITAGLFLTGCGESKPAGNLPPPPEAKLTTDQQAAKDQSILKQAADEKQDGAGGTQLPPQVSGGK